MSSVPIQYIGPKKLKPDNVAGTGLFWTPGEIHNVSPSVAALLLRHPEVWRQAAGDPIEPAAPVPRGLSNPVLSVSAPAARPVDVDDASVPPVPIAKVEAEDIEPVQLPAGINNMSAKQLANKIEREFGIQVALEENGQPVPAATIRARLVGLINSGHAPRG